MATLEKIRNKSGLLVIVIGVALLAFVVGDFFTSGQAFLGDNTTIAKVAGTKIEVQAFQKRYEELNQQMQQSNQKNDDPALLQERIMNGMIQEELLISEFDKLGIYVSTEELTESMVGKNANPRILFEVQREGVPVQTAAELYDMIFNQQKYNNLSPEGVESLKAAWLKEEIETEKGLRFNKFNNLISNAIQANNLDKKALHEETTRTSTINVVKKDFASLKDADFKVTDADLKAEYEKIKEQIKQDVESRRIHYISIDVKPSQADDAAAVALFEKAVATLKGADGINELRNDNDVIVATTTARVSDINDPQLKTFITGAEIGAVSNYSHIGDVYSVAKLIAKKLQSDSITYNMVAVQAPKSTQDSIVNLLNSGTSLQDIAKNKNVEVQADQVMDITQMGKGSEEIKAKILAAGSEYFVVNGSASGAAILKVVKKAAPKQMYEFAEVSYKVLPSSETILQLRDNAQKFIDENKTNKLFAEKAIASGYQAAESFITPLTSQIDRIPNTRRAIKWAFEAEVGAVSPLFDKEGNNKIVIVAVDDIYPAGYAPMDAKEIKEMLNANAIRTKKADALMAKYTGKAKDLAGFASLMESKVDSAVNVNFSQQFIPQIGANESAIMGRVPVAAVNTVVGPIKGNSGIYVFQVTNVDTQGPVFNAEQSSARYSATLGGQAVARQAAEILRKAAKIENNMIKFY